jgi:cyclopropane fatty-acyl-phospholipid synthase-like methyltransferase
MTLITLCRTGLLSAALALALAAPLSAQQHGPGMAGHPRFDDPHKWSQVFDDPARDRWQKPAEVLKALELKRNDRVADIGAGTGYFTVRLARAVPDGMVFAVDIEPNLLRHIEQRAKAEGLANVRPVLGGPASANLPEPVDLAMLVDVYHHIGERPAYFRGLRSALRPGARVVIIDFKPDAPQGPPKSARVPAQRVAEEMKRAGYRHARSFDILPYQYFLVFEPAD